MAVIHQPSIADARIVSDASEPLILVDGQDAVVGTLDKDACHNGDGVLHRAFSAFVFNSAGELLMQQRADDKRLWPGYWSNSCCSHPRSGESMDEAVVRRLEQELGFRADLEFVYKFEYQAPFYNSEGLEGSEHELCSVYVGRFDGQVNANPNEVKQWQWIAPGELGSQLEHQAERFTPWFQMEWRTLTQSYAQHLARTVSPAQP
ncbi:MAG: isopentenyl-diphosphate Delta-isomerase [Pseudomonadota bacterium]